MMNFEDDVPMPQLERAWYVSEPHIEAFEIYRARGYELRGVVTPKEYLRVLRRSYNLKGLRGQQWWMNTEFIVGTQMREHREEERRASNSEGRT